MPFVPVALNHIASACARACADQHTFSAADQAAANTADSAADERALRPAVMPAMTSLREACASETGGQKDESYNRSQDASIEN